MDALSLSDEERSLVRARLVEAAAPSWAVPALEVRDWTLFRDGRGRVSSIHAVSCSAALRGRPSVSCSVLDLAPHAAFCPVCISPQEGSWWLQAHGFFKLLAPLQLAWDLQSAPSWRTLLRALAEADRLLQAGSYPEVPTESCLAELCVATGEAVVTSAPGLAASLPGFTVRAGVVLSLLASSPALCWDPLGVLSDVFGADSPPSPPPPSGPDPLVVLGFPHVIGDPVAALVTLSSPVLARSGTRRLVLVPRSVALLFSSGERGRDRREWAPLPPGLSPGAAETALVLWDPWSDGPLSPLASALAAARAVHA